MNRKTVAAFMLLALNFNIVPAFAGNGDAPPDAVDAQATAFASITPAGASRAATPLASDVDWSLPPVHLGASMVTRGAVLPGLYVSLATLQAYDAYSTIAGLKRGAAESNPLLGQVAKSPAFWIAKGGAAFASIYMAEQLTKKHHRGQAIAVMLLTNGVMAAVAASNARVLRAQR